MLIFVCVGGMFQNQLSILTITNFKIISHKSPEWFKCGKTEYCLLKNIQILSVYFLIQRKKCKMQKKPQTNKQIQTNPKENTHWQIPKLKSNL